MQPTIPANLARQGVTQKTFLQLLAWGWVDLAGNSLDWRYWQAERRG